MNEILLSPTSPTNKQFLLMRLELKRETTNEWIKKHNTEILENHFELLFSPSRTFVVFFVCASCVLFLKHFFPLPIVYESFFCSLFSSNKQRYSRSNRYELMRTTAVIKVRFSKSIGIFYYWYKHKSRTERQ
jgi:hypothetical protein